MTSPSRELVARELFRRHADNPVLSAEDWPYPVNAVFNPSAARVGDETILLARVEDRCGISHLTAVRSSNGLDGWSVDSEPLLAPRAGEESEQWGFEDARTVWIDELDCWAITCTAYGPSGPAVFLASFVGDLQADAYTGYDALYATGRMREIGCWAHARRGFVEALTTDVRAALTVALIQQLYDVERAGADLSPDARRELRHEQSRPLLAKIAAERDQLAQTVLPKSPLGDALRYLTNQWAALQRFVDDGQLAIDNNRAENQLRVVALGRKNWLFAGSFEGARRTALLYSLVQSCKLIDIPPFDYLTDVLLRVATHPQRSIGQLTPKGWADAFRRDVAA